MNFKDELKEQFKDFLMKLDKVYLIRKMEN